MQIWAKARTRAFLRVPNRSAALLSMLAAAGKDCPHFNAGNEWATLLWQSGVRAGPWARRAMPIALEQAVVEKSGIFFRIRL